MLKCFQDSPSFSVLTRILIRRYDVHVYLGTSGSSDLVLVDNKPSYMFSLKNKIKEKKIKRKINQVICIFPTLVFQLKCIHIERILQF